MKPGIARRSVQTLAAAILVAGPASCARAVDPVHTFTIVHLNDVYEIFHCRHESATATSCGAVSPTSALSFRTRVGADRCSSCTPEIFCRRRCFRSGSTHKGAQMIEAMNALPIDMATFGNHEFDFGCRILAERIRQSTFPWIAANVTLPPGLTFPDGRVVPYRLVTIAGLRRGDLRRDGAAGAGALR